MHTHITPCKTKNANINAYMQHLRCILLSLPLTLRVAEFHHMKTMLSMTIQDHETYPSLDWPSYRTLILGLEHPSRHKCVKGTLQCTYNGPTCKFATLENAQISHALQIVRPHYHVFLLYSKRLRQRETSLCICNQE